MLHDKTAEFQGKGQGKYSGMVGVLWNMAGQWHFCNWAGSREDGNIVKYPALRHQVHGTQGTQDTHIQTGLF